MVAPEPSSGRAMPSAVLTFGDYFKSLTFNYLTARAHARHARSSRGRGSPHLHWADKTRRAAKRAPSHCIALRVVAPAKGGAPKAPRARRPPCGAGADACRCVSGGWRPRAYQRLVRAVRRVLEAAVRRQRGQRQTRGRGRRSGALPRQPPRAARCCALAPLKQTSAEQGWMRDRACAARCPRAGWIPVGGRQYQK